MREVLFMLRANEAPQKFRQKKELFLYVIFPLVVLAAYLWPVGLTGTAPC